MKTKSKTNSRSSGKSRKSCNTLVIRKIEKKELKRYKELEGQYHYMGEGRSGGDTMRLVIEHDGKWVALLLYGSACYSLKDRDEYIGWSAPLRARRQKLIVQNRRFTLLSEQGVHPNLASTVLGLAARELPELWYKEFGYKPLLIETFCDIEVRAGTCYKAAGWKALGMTKGFSKHRADFYIPNDRPKKLFVKELNPQALEILTAEELPKEYRAGAKSDDSAVMPLRKEKIESLRDAMRKVPDPRARNRSFKLSSMLTIVAMALLSGHRNIAQIVRFAERMTLKQRRDVGLPRYEEGSSYIKTPAYTAFYNLLCKLDVNAFAEVLSEWLEEHRGELPATLAMDGKFIRDTAGIVCMVDHETGEPAAMTSASKKKGEGENCEQKAAQRMIGNRKDLSNTIITADALHCQRETARLIAERGGEYVFQIKNNQKNVKKQAALKTKDVAPLLHRRRRGTEE